MTFSVNFAWMRDGALAPELSISLSAAVHGRREPFWSFPGELSSVRFLLVPHFRPEGTITVWSERPVVPPEPEKRRRKTGSCPRSPYRPVRMNSCAFACCWRL